MDNRELFGSRRPVDSTLMRSCATSSGCSRIFTTGGRVSTLPKHWMREPREDGRPVLCNCTICDEPIRKYDSGYDFPGFGWVCERCVKKYKYCELTEEDV